jgi:hypothetical protein
VFSFLVVLLGTSLFAAAPAALAPGEARYLVVLNEGRPEPDIAGALGGRIEERTSSAMIVVVPQRVSMSLAGLSGVESVEELSAADTRGAAAPRPGVAEARTATAPFSKRTTLDANTLWASGQYGYDGAGNITSIGNAASPNSDLETSTFTYDAASRLLTASIGRPSVLGDIAESYAYYGFGNLTEHHRTGPLPRIDYFPLPSLSNNRMTEAGTEYDVAGNVTTLGTTTFTYDAFNQVTSKSGGYTYIYDVNEERIGVEYGTTTHWTIRDFDNKPLMSFDGPAPEATQTQWQWVESFVWAGGRMLMAERPSVGQLHYHVDHLGSPRVVTDATGQAIGSGRIDYAPFGEEITVPGHCCPKQMNPG